jgi:hypothetical protein
MDRPTMSGQDPYSVGGESADAWDAIVDERERLADERERLADTREQLATERERLADELERLLDERRDEAAFERDAVPDNDELARANARVSRAIAERDRAQAAVHRRHDAARRADALSSRAGDLADAQELHGEELSWAAERESFVAHERVRLAHARDDLQDVRDELAERREQLADERDVDDRRREHDENTRDANEMRKVASGARARTARARADLQEIRETARRQRHTAAGERQHDREARADAALPAHRAEFGRGLTAQFAALTRELFVSQDLAATTRRVLDFGVQCIPDCVAGGVALLPGHTSTLHITTDVVARQLDALQIEADQGPVAEALSETDPVYVASPDEMSRWPDVAGTAAELGVRSVIAYGLAVPRDGHWQPLGTLALYAEVPDAFDEESRELAGILSCYLSVAAALDRDRADLTRREAALHRALSTRDVIGQAKGILMERRHLTAGEAFDILRTTSQRLNVAVAELATQLTETGELPA